MSKPHASFLSYARSDSRDFGGQPFRIFVEMLRDQLRGLLGGNPEGVLFYDTESMNVGDEWTDSMAKAAGTAATMLGLVSPSYVESEWCGRELEVFVQRQKIHATKPHPRPGIFPVVWVETDPLPEKLANIQNTEGLLASLGIHNKSLRQLANRSSTRDELLTVVEELARLIVITVKAGGLPPHPDLSNLKLVPSAFAPVPSQLTTWVVSAVPWETKVGPDVSRRFALRGVVEDIASQLRSPCRLREMDEINSVTEGAVLVIVNAAAPPPQDLIDWSQQTPVLSVPLSLVLLTEHHVPPGTEKAEIERWAGATAAGTLLSAIADGRHAVVTRDDEIQIRAKLERLWSELEVTTLNAAPLAKVESQPLADNAAAKGISVLSMPSLSAPSA